MILSISHQALCNVGGGMFAADDPFMTLERQLRDFREQWAEIIGQLLLVPPLLPTDLESAPDGADIPFGPDVLPCYPANEIHLEDGSVAVICGDLPWNDIPELSEPTYSEYHYQCW